MVRDRAKLDGVGHTVSRVWIGADPSIDRPRPSVRPVVNILDEVQGTSCPICWSVTGGAQCWWNQGIDVAQMGQECVQSGYPGNIWSSTVLEVGSDGAWFAGPRSEKKEQYSGSLFRVLMLGWNGWANEEGHPPRSFGPDDLGMGVMIGMAKGEQKRRRRTNLCSDALDSSDVEVPGPSSEDRAAMFIIEALIGNPTA